MKILCASSLTHGNEVFSTVGDVTLVSEADITAEIARDFDALAIRSKTTVTDAFFTPGSKLRFVGTATAGTDHLQAKPTDPNIRIVSAGGCNANSVAEFVVAALLELEWETGKKLSGLTLGIVGHGHVGKAVEKRVGALGIRCLITDPPLAVQTADAKYLSLDAVLASADILTLHVPLIEEGRWPTRRFIAANQLALLGKEAWLINACRGEVLDVGALQDAIVSGQLNEVVLDVWDPEPAWPIDLHNRIRFGSAHIAGHSYEGKWNGTLQVYKQLVAWFGLTDKSVSLDCSFRPESRVLDCSNLSLRAVVQTVYDIRKDDGLLRELTSLSPNERVTGFNRLRRSYRHRPEFRNTQLENVSAELLSAVTDLGFELIGR